MNLCALPILPAFLVMAVAVVMASMAYAVSTHFSRTQAMGTLRTFIVVIAPAIGRVFGAAPEVAR